MWLLDVGFRDDPLMLLNQRLHVRLALSAHITHRTDLARTIRAWASMSREEVMNVELLTHGVGQPVRVSKVRVVGHCVSVPSSTGRARATERSDHPPQGAADRRETSSGLAATAFQPPSEEQMEPARLPVAEASRDEPVVGQ